MEQPILVDRNRNETKERFDYRKFYPYYSKPKLIPIIKRIIGVLFAASLGFFLFSNLMGVVIDGEKSAVYWGILRQSVFFLYPFITAYAIYRYTRTKVYDSQKYSVSLLFTVIIILYNGFWIWTLVGLTEAKAIRESSKFIVWLVFNLLEVFLIILGIVLQFILVIIRPRVDQERIKKIQKQMQKKALANLEGKEYEVDWTGLD